MPPSQEPRLAAATARAVDTVTRNVAAFGAAYPDDITTAGRYRPRPADGAFAEGANRGWTTGFWAGLAWLAWELTGDDTLAGAARGYAGDFARRLEAAEELDTHDLGFLYSLSTVPAWRLLGDEPARDVSIRAAGLLAQRFTEPAGIIQAWGEFGAPGEAGRTIVDSVMNVPLLRWAGAVTGAQRLVDIADRHTENLRAFLVRPDGSTFHTFAWDPGTGQPLAGGTRQGASADSCWARGQAWAVYGFALGYRANRDPRLLDAARTCAGYYLAHLPGDLVPYWDLSFADGSGAPRDSSAAAIAACGLLELADADSDGDPWRRAAERICGSLIDAYTPAPGDADALLLHGVYDYPTNYGVDEGNLWGDYFFLELLVRLGRPGWRPYW